MRRSAGESGKVLVRRVHPRRPFLVLPSTFHEYRIDTCWVSAVKEADTTIRSVESCYVVVAMAVDVGHPGDFALPALLSP
jgi:hypothetical protein